MLDDREQRALSRIEHALASSDPGLAARLRGHRHGWLHRALSVVGGVILGVPLGAVTGLALTALLGISVLSAEVLVAPALLLVVAASSLWIMISLERTGPRA